MKSIFHVYIFKHYKFKCNNENEARELSKIRNPGHEGLDGLEVFNIKIKKLKESKEQKMAEQIKEAKKQKHCPYCKGQDFNVTFESSERGFCFRNGEIEWEEKDKEKIEVIQCNICLEEIPIEVWIEWIIKVGD